MRIKHLSILVFIIAVFSLISCTATEKVKFNSNNGGTYMMIINMRPTNELIMYIEMDDHESEKMRSFDSVIEKFEHKKTRNKANKWDF